ncbi:DUF4892 domain-containing protein [Proteobacteria bacterium 005FR1]|nr:DUF4892 domain-containing protein [Proteobacteria bacterium 005FR1]
MSRLSPKLFYLATLLSLFLSVGLSHAAPSQAKLDDLVTPYPRSEMVDRSNRSVVDYLLATDAVRKVGGRWAPEESLRKAGELTRLTFQIPEGHGPQEVFRFYRERLAGLDARAIYLCSERNCGSSNSWANDVFGVKQLYGLDQYQYYGIFEVVDESDRLNYVVVYTIRRGNDRVYAHLEWLRTNEGSAASVPPNPNAIVEQLREQGYYDVPGLRLEEGRLVIQEEHLSALAQALRSNPRLSLHVVGHDYGRRPLATQMERSQSFAETLVGKLKDKGVKTERLKAHGVGGLVPTRITAGKRQRDFRVELVLVE